MATLVGKVGIVMKGAWNSANTYEELDAVSYNNGLYVAKQAVPANTAPTNATYWQPAITSESLLDGLIVSFSSTRAANLTMRYLGGHNSFKLTGDFSADQSIVMYIGYPTNSGAPTMRGIYAVDRLGVIVDLSGVGGTLPTASVNEAKTEMTINVPYSYGYVYLLSYRPLTLTV